MNKKSFLSLLLVSSICFVSCKKELEPQESSATPAAPVTETAAPQIQAPQAMPQNMPAAAQQPQANMPQPTQTAQTAPGMNPPHGQPNHRCDIAVGAPLNSPATKGAVQATPGATITPATPAQTMKVSNPPASTTPAILNPNAAPTATAPGMNPPHGQPGHKCDIAVGAPLPKA